MMATPDAEVATSKARHSPRNAEAVHNAPSTNLNLQELADVPPVENPEDSPIYRHKSLEEARSRVPEQSSATTRRNESMSVPKPAGTSDAPEPDSNRRVSQWATQLYTISYLILFSLLGTLARLGLQAITSYPGAPTAFSSLWPNFGGSLFMGFVTEDRMLFRREWGTSAYDNAVKMAQQAAKDEESGISGTDKVKVDLAAAKRAHAATKKTIPLYIGLATGFCGSFTSFSSFIRDSFLALSNDLVAPDAASASPRNGGYSFMAVVAVLLVTVALSLSGLFIGAHLAIALEPVTPSLPFRLTRKLVDRLAVFLAWGCWLGAILLSVFPPDRFNTDAEVWRGRATFALVFAPLGCLARFYASLYLNGRKPSFPLGTFAVNVAGTAILALCWDLAHIPLGGVVGCQVLQGIEDGFCGCLTTVSTWVAELSSLRRRNAYIYGSASFLASLACMVAIMGGLRWSAGFANLECHH